MSFQDCQDSFRLYIKSQPAIGAATAKFHAALRGLDTICAERDPAIIRFHMDPNLHEAERNAILRALLNWLVDSPQGIRHVFILVATRDDAFNWEETGLKARHCLFSREGYESPLTVADRFSEPILPNRSGSLVSLDGYDDAQG